MVRNSSPNTFQSYNTFKTFLVLPKRLFLHARRDWCDVTLWLEQQLLAKYHKSTKRMVLEGLPGLNLAFQLANATPPTLEALRALVSQEGNLGNFYRKMLKLLDERAVLRDADAFEENRAAVSAPVMSPMVNALINLYAPPTPAKDGVIYVMYAKSGQGKTFAGRSMLEEFYEFSTSQGEPAEYIKGLMITGEDLDADYNASLCDILGGREVNGWIHALLLALDQPRRKQPGLLILDSFNSLGNATEDGNYMNVKFIKRLYNLINGMKNLFVVVITQEKTVADKLCSMNNGQRIAPVPTTYTGEPTSPQWKSMKCSREILIEVVRYWYPTDFAEDHTFAFITDGMTPLAAVQTARYFLRTPGNPRRVAKST